MYNAHVNCCYMHFSVGVGVGVHNHGDSVVAARSGAFGHCVTPLDGADLHKTSICITEQNTKHKI